MNDIPIRERTKALEEQMLALPLYFSDPVIIGRHPDLVGEAKAVLFTASCTFLELGDRKVLVTNAHVIQHFLDERNKDDRTIFQIPDLLCDDFSERLLDIDAKSDLATLALDDIELRPRNVEREALKPRQFYRPATWPPAEVSEGDVVALGGWPGALRKDRNGLRDVEHNPYSIIAVGVTHAMPDRFNVKIDRSDIHFAFGRTEGDAKDFSFEGMSGSPVFRKGRLAYELVGIVSQYNEIADTFVVSAIRNIKRDGSLWHNSNR